MDIHKAYLTTPGIKKDRSQIDILNKLLKLQSQLVSSKNKASFIQKYIQPTPLIKGIYGGTWGEAKHF